MNICMKEEIKKQIELNNFEVAHELLTKYKKENIDIYSIEGILAIKENDLEYAFESFSKGLEIDNKNVDLLYNMAYLSTLIDDMELSIYYYNKCLEYTDDTELKNEIYNILNQLNINMDNKEDEKKIIIIDFVVDVNFEYGENAQIINIINNENLDNEIKNEMNGITTYEASSKIMNHLIERIIKKNKNPLVIFRDIDKWKILENLKDDCIIAYYPEKNYYLEKINYYRNSKNIFIEKNICNSSKYIFTNDIDIYIYKRIVERRDNIYLLKDNIYEILDLEYLINNNDNIIKDRKNNIFKSDINLYQKEYNELTYDLVLNFNNNTDYLEIAKNMYMKYPTEEVYHIYISILNYYNKHREIINMVLNSKYCTECFKLELIHMNNIGNSELTSFIVDLSIKNYKIIDNRFNGRYTDYKVAAYYFEIGANDSAIEIYIKNIKIENSSDNSPMINRNIFHLLYLTGSKEYVKYENMYTESREKLLDF